MHCQQPRECYRDTRLNDMARLEGEDLRIMMDEEDKVNPKKGFEGRLEHDPSAVPVDREDD